MTHTGSGLGPGTMVFILRYVLHTLHRNRDRDREPLFSIVPIPFPVPVMVRSRVVCMSHYNGKTRYTSFQLIRGFHKHTEIGTHYSHSKNDHSGTMVSLVV